MNNTASEFFQKHGMNVSKLSAQKESHIFSTWEIDMIVANYGINENEQQGRISVADIIGYNAFERDSKNIYYSFDSFFDRDGTRYQKRSCGLLDIPPEDIIPALSRSFEDEPIVVNCIHGNNNLIYNNGLHRYSVLRAHFLNETFGLSQDSEEYERVKQKYTFPAKIKKVDLIKTYSNYLLSLNPNLDVSLSSEFDDNFNYTGKVVVTLPNGEKRVLNNDQLIDFTRELVIPTNDPDYLKQINIAQEHFEKFGEYVDTYLPELSIKQKENYGGGMKV